MKRGVANRNAESYQGHMQGSRLRLCSPSENGTRLSQEDQWCLSARSRLGLAQRPSPLVCHDTCTAFRGQTGTADPEGRHLPQAVLSERGAGHFRAPLYRYVARIASKPAAHNGRRRENVDGQYFEQLVLPRKLSPCCLRGWTDLPRLGWLFEYGVLGLLRLHTGSLG